MPVIELASDGSLPLPEEIRKSLSLRPGDLLNVEIVDGSVRLSRHELPKPKPAAKPKSVSESDPVDVLQTPMRFIKGVGPKLADTLAKKGIATVEDALYVLPHRYEDRRELRPVARLRPGMTEAFFATIVSAQPMVTKGGRNYFEAIVADDSGSIPLKWFHYHPQFMKRNYLPGRRGIFIGDVSQFAFQREVHHPEVEWVAEGEDLAQVMARDPENFGRILPVYPLTEGVSQKVMRKIMRETVQQYSRSVKGVLPEPIVQRQKLMSLPVALREAHAPDASARIDHLNEGKGEAHRSLAFDELFFLELGLALKRRGITLEDGISFQVTHRYTRELAKLLPFSLTNAQRRVLSEIKEDMIAPHPMHRLVQGDVGCGKTLVALMAALIAVENDYQVAIMAPTELLAEQHYLNIHRYCEQLGIKVTLLTSGVKAKSGVLELIAQGETQIVVGTHAMIQDKVEFHRLGLGVIDEQHRFGVVQRALLKKKGSNPDILVMTATPIPRTLSMTVFGDLALSVIDELPPGRTPIETRIVRDSRRAQTYQMIRGEVVKGRQAYIIYPLVEESEKSDLKAAVQMADHLKQDIFPDLKVALLHGRMSASEKEGVMSAFKGGETNILVATTVIEVGIDVPNATIMVIEHAERFGLSQLHQLRGRVGRGSERSFCILMTGDRRSEDGEKRLEVMVSSQDGFRIAEADLSIRGPGDFLGTRQAGIPELKVADILRDGGVLEEARKEAFALVGADPDLEAPGHDKLKAELMHRWGGRLELASIA
ncbi:ATP-dependent DNA helicase RecG [Geomesophilobacter sediminis]|uniref:ATP-dependent DNA helicase RecG n=1 Tax=Geomesophilobacter sediminis TaxID=2798584 RepID=A0A8J7LXW5_9BACT|nr:ATP-dependent DNA helicase RecG [Geomesophilobacter sediminis]MBJ6723832.1 ATP-dependent DNA helicase RecG [Geomesophilobacter sediminis]